MSAARKPDIEQVPLLNVREASVHIPELVLALDSTNALTDVHVLQGVGRAAGLVKLARKRVVVSTGGINRRSFNWTYTMQIANEHFDIRRFMLDFKIFDEADAGSIVADLSLLRPDVISVHSQAGGAAMRAAVGNKNISRIAAHTIDSRTSNEECRAVHGINRTSRVLRLAELAISNGADIVVAPANDIDILRRRYPDVTLMATGAVLPGDDPRGHEGAMAPADILAAGADYFVMGRAFAATPNPEDVLGALVDNLS